MTALIDALASNPAIAAGAAAFLCGVALLYLVVQRTRKRRAKSSDLFGA